MGLLGNELIGQNMQPAHISRELLKTRVPSTTLDHLLSVVYWTTQAGCSRRRPGILRYGCTLIAISVSMDSHSVDEWVDHQPLEEGISMSTGHTLSSGGKSAADG